jgi:PDZ domain
MNTLTPKAVLALLAALTIASFAVPAAVAATPQPLLVAPGEPNGPYFSLPKFGFASQTIYGFGERVTYVKWNGRAAQLGLEPGDVILSMNGIPLTYHGSWNDALRQAILNGGWVKLRIRDVNSGHVAFRQTFVGDDCYGGPIQHYNVGYPVGPNTSHVHHYNGKNNGATVLDLVKLFKDNKKKNKP